MIDPLTHAELTDAPKRQSPYRIRELEREKQIVLKAIKEIELDHQMRKISDADYHEMVERYRARALRILGDLAAGDDYRALIERELKDRLAATRAAEVAATAPGGETAARDAAAERGPVTAPGEATAPEATAAKSGGSAHAPSAEASPSTENRCPACATVNDDDARFCKGCGHALAAG